MYIYTVRAYYGSGASVYMSNYDHTGTYWIDTPKMKKAQAYSSLSEASKGQTRYDIMVGWNDVDGADGYYLYRKVGNGKWKKIKNYSVSDGFVALFLDRGVKQGTTYSYTVRAYCKVNGKIILGGYDSKGSTVTAK